MAKQRSDLVFTFTASEYSVSVNLGDVDIVRFVFPQMAAGTQQCGIQLSADGPGVPDASATWVGLETPIHASGTKTLVRLACSDAGPTALQVSPSSLLSLARCRLVAGDNADPPVAVAQTCVVVPRVRRF